MIHPTADQIQVLIVDDHQLVIEGIKALLQSEADIEVAAEATSGAEALRLLPQHPEVTLAVLDLSMPHMSGVELARAIRATYPQIHILALSVFYDHASVAEVLDAGGSGYLLKNTTKAELSAAIRQVAAGRTFFSQEVGSTLLDNLQFLANRTQVYDERPVELTSREKEVLQLIAREYSNFHIAEELFISERTVETHRKNMLTKTNSKSVVGLIRYALRHKLIG